MLEKLKRTGVKEVAPGLNTKAGALALILSFVVGAVASIGLGDGTGIGATTTGATGLVLFRAGLKGGISAMRVEDTVRDTGLGATGGGETRGSRTAC